jgi:hypothetical protein
VQDILGSGRLAADAALGEGDVLQVKVKTSPDIVILTQEGLLAALLLTD